MVATQKHFELMFGSIIKESAAMPRCACVACNSCTCACSCRKSPDLDTIGWDE